MVTEMQYKSTSCSFVPIRTGIPIRASGNVAYLANTCRNFPETKATCIRSWDQTSYQQSGTKLSNEDHLMDLYVLLTIGQMLALMAFSAEMLRDSFN